MDSLKATRGNAVRRDSFKRKIEKEIGKSGNDLFSSVSVVSNSKIG